MSAAEVVTQRHAGWAELVLNRPNRRNAIIGATVEQLIEQLAALAADEAVAAVVLRGEGGVFCSGLDLRQPPDRQRFPGLWVELHRALAGFPTVVIGALERAAVAGGASLALACDLLVAGDQAFLSVPELEMGRLAPMNVAWLVYKHGPARAMEATLGGRLYRGEELLRAGLAFEVVPDPDVRSRAGELAERFAGYDRQTVVQMKQAVRAAAARPFDEVLNAVA